MSTEIKSDRKIKKKTQIEDTSQQVKNAHVYTRTHTLVQPDVPRKADDSRITSHSRGHRDFYLVTGDTVPTSDSPIESNGDLVSKE